MSNQTKVAVTDGATIHYVVYAESPMVPCIIVTCPEAGAQFTIEPKYGFGIVMTQDWPETVSKIANAQFLSADDDDDAAIERNKFAVELFGEPVPLDPSTFEKYDQVSQTSLVLKAGAKLLTFTDSITPVPEKNPGFDQMVEVRDGERTVHEL